MSEIIPAIIPKSFSDLNEKLSLVKGFAPLVQIDVLDGKFTSQRSWPYIFSPDPDFVKIIREEEGFPFSDNFEFEIDLMVADPESHFQEWISAGARRLIPHIESFENSDSAACTVKRFKEQFTSVDSILALEIGMAINIETPNESLDPLILDVDFVQCMGIQDIGSQGQPFNDRVLEKVKELHSKYPDLTISIDGGVNADSIPLLVEAGAKRFVVGSAIFGSDDIPATIEELKNL